MLDRSATVVLDRPEKPLIEPFGLTGEDTNIAFAASAIVSDDNDAYVYYSIADRRPCRIEVSFEGLAI